MGRVNKLLLPFGETTLIEHVVDTVRRSDADEVVVVLGHEADRVRAALTAHDVAIAINDRYREGMTTSIQAGVRAALPEAAGFMICLSDLPLIEPEELNLLITAFKTAVCEDEQLIVIPTFAGRRGHPVIFASSYRPDILAHKVMSGCRDIVTQNRDHALDLPMPTDHVLHDIDTMDAYERLG